MMKDYLTAEEARKLNRTSEDEPVEVKYEETYASFGFFRMGWSFLHYFHEYIEPRECEVVGNIYNYEL